MSPLVAYFGKVRFLINKTQLNLWSQSQPKAQEGTEQAQTGLLAEQGALPNKPTSTTETGTAGGRRSIDPSSDRGGF